MGQGVGDVSSPTVTKSHRSPIRVSYADTKWVKTVGGVTKGVGDTASGATGTVQDTASGATGGGEKKADAQNPLGL